MIGRPQLVLDIAGVLVNNFPPVLWKEISAGSNENFQLIPVLSGFEVHLKSITISNQVGLCKPDIRIYELVESYFNSKDRVLYIDDQEKNLKPAANLGWNTLLADNQNNWIKDVEPLLRADL